MGAKDLAEKNLLQYKDVFSDIVNVNLSAVTNDRRYRKAKELIEETEGKGGKIDMCVLLDMYEERGIQKGIAQRRSDGIKGLSRRGARNGKGNFKGSRKSKLYHCLFRSSNGRYTKSNHGYRIPKGIAV